MAKQKIRSIISHWRSANQLQMSLPTYYASYNQKQTISTGEDVEKLKLVSKSSECKMMRPLGKTIGQVLKKKFKHIVNI